MAIFHMYTWMLYMNCRFWPTLTLLAHCARRVWRTQWYQPFYHRGLPYFLIFHILYKLSTCLHRSQKDMMNTMTSTLLAPGARRAPHPQDCHILTFHILYKVTPCQKPPSYPQDWYIFNFSHIVQTLHMFTTNTMTTNTYFYFFVIYFPFLSFDWVNVKYHNTLGVYVLHIDKIHSLIFLNI